MVRSFPALMPLVSGFFLVLSCLDHVFELGFGEVLNGLVRSSLWFLVFGRVEKLSVEVREEVCDLLSDCVFTVLVGHVLDQVALPSGLGD